jgi:hypothetical protein
MSMMKPAAPFLTADWHHLTLANYAVPDDLLRPHLAPGLTLDRFEGSAFVSLVAFDFLRTKVLGIPFPGFRNFPEINLRFYVRQGEKRGVQFIREYVPSALVAWIARTLYNEPYHALPMRNESAGGTTGATFVYHIGDRQISTEVAGPAFLPPEESAAHFFKEHSWGYGISRTGEIVQYEVGHPVWQCRQVAKFSHTVDFGALYGQAWAFLNNETPRSVFFALGSAIRVSQKNRTLRSAV